MGKPRAPVSWVSPREATEEEVAVNHGLAKQCVAAFIVSLTNLNCGLATHWISPTSLELTAGANIVGKFTVNDVSNKIVTSHYAAVLSALLMGLVANWYGRKPALYLSAIINIIGGAILRKASDNSAIWAGNACASCSIVSGLLIGPMLISEISHRRVRGALVIFCTLQYSLGMLAGYLIRPSKESTNIFQIIYIVIPATQIVLYIFIPESPFFLVSKSRVLEAEGSLFWSRGSKRSIAKGELAILVKSPLSTEQRTFWQIIRSQSTRKAFLLSTGLVMFQRMSGFMVFAFYSNNIIIDAGNIFSKEDTGAVLTGIQVATSLVLLCVIDLVGRKLFLYISYFGNFMTLLVLTIYLTIRKFGAGIGELNWLPFVCMLIFIVFYNMGAASLTTVLPNEVTPVRVKGIMASIDGVLTSLLVLAVALYTPAVKQHLGDYMNFLIPTIMNMIALIFIWGVVRETKCKSLLQCSEKLHRKPSGSKLLKNEVTYL